MGYRNTEKCPRKPEDTLPRFDVRNGAVMRVAFGCFYALDGHDPRVHDHYGWPAPEHPDNICQISPIGDRWYPFPNARRPMNLEPIHLIEEGYSDVRVSIDDDEIAEYLKINAWIDEADDYIVRMSVKANFPTFYDKPVETRFTVFAANWQNSTIDAVCHAFITVLPGSPFPEGDAIMIDDGSDTQENIGSIDDEGENDNG